MRANRLFIAIVLIAIPALHVRAASVDELVDALRADQKRPAAIEALLKMGEKAEADLRKSETAKDLDPRQRLIVRRLLGELLIKQTPFSPLDLSPLVPMGEDKERKKAGNPDILIHPTKKLVVVNGQFAIDDGLLEYIVASFRPDTKVHESIVGVRPTAGEISTAMLLREFAWSGEIADDGKVNLPKDTGVNISVEFEWEAPHAAMDVNKTGADDTRKWVRVPIEYFAWNTQTQKPMKCIPFAFNGSMWGTNMMTGKKAFMADMEGCIVAAKLDPAALMNSPLDTHSINPHDGEAGYWINRCIVPAPGSKCRVVFEQYSGPELTDADLKDTADAEEKSGK